VIEVSGSHTGSINEGLLEIQRISRLTPVEFRCPLGFTPDGGISYSGVALFDHKHFGSPPARFDDDTLEALREVYKGNRLVAANYKSIDRAIHSYYQLTAIPRTHSLYILGVFAIIESLLTHNPKGVYDSLGHQIKTKLSLLNRRFRVSLDCSPFRGADFTTVWSKMYTLRSCIAHGSDTDFSRGDLQCLGSAEVATAFLDEAAKTLLQHALVEPDLILDLQAC
jgi:Apea-like HEPN